MGALELMRRPAMSASTLENPSVPLNSVEFARLAGGQSAWTGRTVNVGSAITYVAMYSCVRVLAETFAQLPGGVFERQKKGRLDASEHWMFPLIQEEANSEMTAYEFFELGMFHIGFTGNFYAEIEWNNAGNEVLGFWPLRPDRTSPVRVDGKIMYQTAVRAGLNAPLKNVTLPADRVLHVLGPGFDGLKGMNPLSVLRQAIGLGLALEEYAARVFSNGASPRLILKYGTTVTPEVAKDIRSELEPVLTGGLDNAHRTAILEEGIGIEKLSWSPQEVQSLEARTHQARQVNSFYRVPAHMTNDLERATFTNIEHQELELVKHTLGPYNQRWEQRLNRVMRRAAGASRSKTFYIKFNVDGLLRGDYKTRMEGNAHAIQNGIKTPDEVREQDEMNPREDGLGDKYWMPANYSLAETVAAQSQDAALQQRDALRKKDPTNPATPDLPQKGVSPAPPGQAPPMPPGRKKAWSALAEKSFRDSVFLPAYQDLARVECKAVERILEKAIHWTAEVQGELEKFYLAHEGRLLARLRPCISGLASLLGANEPGEECAQGAARRYMSESLQLLARAAASDGDTIGNMRAALADWKDARPLRAAAFESSLVASAAHTEEEEPSCTTAS